ncbi:serine hydrolase [uncultured Oscillibacter sp.]|uniref:serine hydrolase domain-containing protein n=1 Tax=uncultured Oscillibacter sp. TaxID=876091 RepID=UPI0026065AF9|nr:serine hydrolase domain-containing protein [uncultured Oscillibacter sp.]
MKQKTHTLSALLLALALSLSLVLPVSAAQDGGTALDKAARTSVASAMSYGQATQASWAVWQDGNIVSSGSQRATGGGGSAALEEEGGVYGIGSVSKIFTTVAVMQLAESGKLDLDQPVVKYLPDFKMADPRYKDITVRMLLNHSSGLMGSSFGSGMLFDDPSPAATRELLDRLATQRLKADPGAFSVYCNDGFTLAELVVEAVTGMKFQDYLQASIFEKAGLEETYLPGDAFEDRRVDIYQPGDERPLPKDCLGVLGAGGLYATAEDLASFGGALTKQTLLKKSSLNAMAAPEYAKGLWPGEEPDALAFGLGWDNVEWYPFALNDIPALVKGGDTQYYHAGLVVLPEHKLAAAVLSAGGVSTYNEMAASQMLIAALGQKDVEVVELRLRLPAAKKAAMPAELLDSAGYYGSLSLYQVDLDEDGTLTMRYPAMPEVPALSFSYYDDGSFRDEKGTSALRLVKEDNGETYLYQWTFTDLPELGGLPGSNYAAMKLPENQVDPALQAQWESIMGGAVLPMNERYSSQLYASLGALLQVEPGAVKGAPGYIGSMRIEDGTHLRYAVQIPGNAGRDGSDIEIRRDGKGALWFYQSNGGVYMDLNAVPVLSTGTGGKTACTIQPDGYARWYKIGDNADGKTLTVQMPENAGFWAYDAKGTLVASSVLWGDESAKLFRNGMIVFAGDPGARFELSFQ